MKPLSKEQIRSGLIQNGVRNLHEFGYELCNRFNIMEDEIYSVMFRRMLEENLPKAKGLTKDVISDLLKEL